MGNPVTVQCPANQWTMVAAGVQRGTILISYPLGILVLGSYKVENDPPPTSIEEATELTNKNRFLISGKNDIDIYIWPVNENAEIRVSV